MKRTLHLISLVALAGALFGSGCAMASDDGAEGLPLAKTESAQVKALDVPAQVGAGAGVAGVGTCKRVVVAAPSPGTPTAGAGTPVPVLEVPLSSPGDGHGCIGDDEGPRPNPWTPPPDDTKNGGDKNDNSSDTTKSSSGSPTK